jgi:hypothetical protein
MRVRQVAETPKTNASIPAACCGMLDAFAST